MQAHQERGSAMKSDNITLTIAKIDYKKITKQFNKKE